MHPTQWHDILWRKCGESGIFRIPLKTALIILTLILSQTCTSQTTFNVLNEVDELPEFATAPGLSFERVLLRTNNAFLKYPESALEEDIEGTVYAEFMITADCEVRDIKIIRSPDSCLDQAVIDAISCYSFCVPAMKNATSTDVTILARYTFRICP